MKRSGRCRPKMDNNNDNTQSFVALTKGTEVGHYKIVEKIGAGGMGEVYLAEDSKLKRHVALKFMPLQYMNDDALRQRFTREARSVAALSHPNVVTIHEVDEFNGRPFFAMEHVEGESLRKIIKKGKLNTDEAVNYTMQICEGLHKAHESGIIHRDIKPGNIIIDADNRARILDFGLAMVTGEDKLTKTGSTLGTVGYMSPEQIEGKKVDQRSDIFSVGVILYEMVTGRRPFEGDNDAAIVKAITSSTPEPIARFKSGVTGELQRIIDKALVKDPSLRYQHADGILADLKRLRSDSAPYKKSRLVFWAALAAVIVIIGGYFGYTQFFKEKPKPAGPKRLVVLPFENLSESGKDYFAAGITEEITSRLANIRGLAVIPRGTANLYSKSEKTMSQIGSELNADYIVDGTMRWQKNADGGEERVRIGVHLIDVDQDASIWSKTYDTVITEVFSIQSDISENVTEQMGIKLNVIDKKKIWERYTNSSEAYDFYLQGNKFRSRYGGFTNITDYRLAAEMFNKAIALDSNFVMAFIGLCWSYCMQWERGDHADSIKQKASAAAQKLQELRPDSEEAGRAMANYYYFILGDSKKALDKLTKAYEGDLDNSTYLSLSHNYLRTMGNWDEAYRRKKILAERDSKDIGTVFDLGQDCLYMRRYEEAEKLFDQVIEKQPDFFNAYWCKVHLYINWMGDVEKAREVIQQSRGKVDSTRWRGTKQWLDIKEGNFELALSRITMPRYDSLSYYFNRADIYKRSRRPDLMRAYFDSASAHVEKFLFENPDNPDAHSYMGIVYAGLGITDKAIREGKKAVELAPLEKDFWNNFECMDYLLQIYVMLDEKDSALEMLEHMLTVYDKFGLAHVFIDPDYTPMLDYPGFNNIVEKYGNEYTKELWNKHAHKLN